MSMNRAIHAAVRRDLDRFLNALERFPAGNRRRAAQLATAWQNFDDQLTQHHQSEHEIAWPALQKVGVSQEVLAQLDAEHDTMATALTAARTAMGALSNSATAADATAAHTAMQELQRVTVEHFDHEEKEIEPVYLEREGTPELKAMGREFAKVSPTQGGTFFAWALDGATATESSAITRTIPKPVLTVILGLFGRRYRKSVAPVWRN
ncbi:hemerythrin domain-containing protein [Kribbella aluminosa]|nr:hemerythrin domain-containing protein [Kribbella aluminosa]